MAVQNRPRLALVLVCAAACFPSGFNLVSMGYVAPRLSADLGLVPGGLLPVFVAAGAGNVLGSLTFGPLADRFGRKMLVVGGLACSLPFVVGTALAGSVWALATSQFGANFFLMGALPVALTIAGGEYVPEAVKTRAVSVAWLGFMLGTILAGVAVALLSPGFGPRAVFVLDAAAIAAIAGAVGLRLPSAPEHVQAMRRAELTVRLLFTEGRAPLTLVLWAMFLANLTLVFFLTSWLTTLLRGQGLAETAAVALATLLQVGSALGGIAIAAIVDRRRRARFAVLVPAFVLGGMFVGAIGLAGGNGLLAGLAVFLAGICASGAQNAAIAMVAFLYPIAMRSTGASWAIGIGQSGQILGALFGATLLLGHWPIPLIFDVLGLAPVIAALCALLIESKLVRAPQ